jgi:hypothetical protein
MEIAYIPRQDRREALTQLLIEKMKVFADAWTPEKVCKTRPKKSLSCEFRTTIPSDIGGDIVRGNTKYPKSCHVKWQPLGADVHLTIKHKKPKVTLGGFLEHKANLSYRMKNASLFDPGVDSSITLKSKSPRRNHPRKLPSLSKQNLSHLGQLPCARDCSADTKNLDRIGKSLHKNLEAWCREDREELHKFKEVGRVLYR